MEKSLTSWFKSLKASDERFRAFEALYHIKGDGVAVLRPEKLREDAEFVEMIREMEQLQVIELGDEDASEVS